MSRRQTIGGLAHTWLELPSGGYDGPVPPWPIVTNERSGADDDAQLDERETEVWAELWRSPQAAAWARNGWTHDVALYVRFLVKGEFGDLDSAKESRMWSDRLGLNPAAMLKNRWRVSADQVAKKRSSGALSSAEKARRRLKIADTSGGISS